MTAATMAVTGNAVRPLRTPPSRSVTFPTIRAVTPTPAARAEPFCRLLRLELMELLDDWGAPALSLRGRRPGERPRRPSRPWPIRIPAGLRSPGVRCTFSHHARSPRPTAPQVMTLAPSSESPLVRTDQLLGAPTPPDPSGHPVCRLDCSAHGARRRRLGTETHTCVSASGARSPGCRRRGVRGGPTSWFSLRPRGEGTRGLSGAHSEGPQSHS